MRDVALVFWGTDEVMEIEKTITPQPYGNHKDLGFVYI